MGPNNHSFFATFIIIILSTVYQTAFSSQGDPEIFFNKSGYGPFDDVYIVMIHQKSNSNPKMIEMLTTYLSTPSMLKDQKPAQDLLFKERSADSGVFKARIKLTPDPMLWPGDIVVHRDDDLIIEFKTIEGQLFTGYADVDYYTSAAIFTEPTYKISESSRIIVIDIDENRNPHTFDILKVVVWSSTDRGGLSLVLRETGAKTGIFEEVITFVLDEQSSGTRLRVSEGDTITVKYTDRTLPPPAALSANGFETIEVEELFASAKIGYLTSTLARAVASEPRIVDEKGEILKYVTAGQQLLIQVEITNSQNRKQPFTYIIQIKDELGSTLSLSWLTGELPQGESITTGQSWIPDTKGLFSVEVFVWKSINDPLALSPVRSMQQVVS